jgi:hypothetical protein
MYSILFLYPLFSLQLTYLTEENWATMISGYRAQCEGQGRGIVSSYEEEEAEEAKEEL